MDTLLLSQSFEPVEQVSWQRAMTLWIAGRVEVIEAYGDRRVQSPSQAFEMPSIVRYIRGRRPFRQTRVKFSKPDSTPGIKDAVSTAARRFASSSPPLTMSFHGHEVAPHRGKMWSSRRPCNQKKAIKRQKKHICVSSQLPNAPHPSHGLS